MRTNLVLAIVLFSSVGSWNFAHAKENSVSSWAKYATQADLARYQKWDKSLAEGVAEAERAGYSKEMASRAPLFSNNFGKRSLGLPSGQYRCSITKLGGGRGLAYISYPKFRCMVTKVGDRWQFTKLTGSQMTSGWIYPTGLTSGVYLGTSYYGYEDRAPKYGTDERRDDVAVVDRIGDRRWRIVFPYPYYESVVDVMELTPVR